MHYSQTERRYAFPNHPKGGVSAHRHDIALYQYIERRRAEKTQTMVLSIASVSRGLRSLFGDRAAQTGRNFDEATTRVSSLCSTCTE